MSIVVVQAACVAPPMGIGRGASLVDPAQPASLAVGAGVAERRVVSQVDGSITFSRSPRFSFDAGAVYTQFVDRGPDMLVAAGVFPYIRPRFTFGPWSIAVAMSGMAIGAGEGGLLAGFTDVQVGYGGRSWSIYGGGYGSACVVADGGPIVAAAQLRVGAEYLFPIGTRSLGVAGELYRHVESLQADYRSPVRHADLLGGGVKLRLAW